MANWEKIERVVRSQIDLLHEELGWFDEEELKNTPRRVMKYYQELEKNSEFSFTVFDVPPEHTKSMIVLRNIDFYSLCSHHLMPFFGKVHVVYLPRENGKICGVSKLARVVKKYASRPQLQERMSNEIASGLMKELDAWFVMVVIEAKHLCMLARGVNQHESEMVTSAVRWDKKEEKVTKDFNSLKEEAMKLIYSRVV